jgi:hypothetical protein
VAGDNDEHDDKKHGEGPVPQASDDIQLELISLQKLALTSPTIVGRSVGIVHSRTLATEFSFFSLFKRHIFFFFNFSIELKQFTADNSQGQENIIKRTLKNTCAGWISWLRIGSSGRPL